LNTNVRFQSIKDGDLIGNGIEAIKATPERPAISPPNAIAIISEILSKTGN
jgi:hypothetical protein